MRYILLPDAIYCELSNSFLQNFIKCIILAYYINHLAHESKKSGTRVPIRVPKIKWHL